MTHVYVIVWQHEDHIGYEVVTSYEHERDAKALRDLLEEIDGGREWHIWKVPVSTGTVGQAELKEPKSK